MQHYVIPCIIPRNYYIIRLLITTMGFPQINCLSYIFRTWYVLTSIKKMIVKEYSSWQYIFIHFVEHVRPQNCIVYIRQARSAKCALVAKYRSMYRIILRLAAERPTEIVQLAYVLFISHVTASVVPYKGKTRAD